MTIPSCRDFRNPRSIYQYDSSTRDTTLLSLLNKLQKTLNTFEGISQCAYFTKSRKVKNFGLYSKVPGSLENLGKWIKSIFDRILGEHV